MTKTILFVICLLLPSLGVSSALASSQEVPQAQSPPAIAPLPSLLPLSAALNGSASKNTNHIEGLLPGVESASGSLPVTPIIETTPNGGTLTHFAPNTPLPLPAMLLPQSLDCPQGIAPGHQASSNTSDNAPTTQTPAPAAPTSAKSEKASPAKSSPPPKKQKSWNRNYRRHYYDENEDRWHERRWHREDPRGEHDDDD